ncbi:sensor domain-containing diguanylate cyclase [Fuchsiella alkaliacetigena]|uniref:sensor domain-containing diguanylate cyclase n=1 Tax=Fuchsiella alkaliacetigena TaxID=957042 RepID=UPI00200B07B2|nr:sensor domain-containing diguanylate cyclase [Fuchsiella alkaliacetigena]MCK8823740.1 sensor domain-containing diguanylate cyclase [Fuchsiella alkaliacetigena]
MDLEKEAKDNEIIEKLNTLYKMIKEVYSVTNLYQTLESIVDIGCELLLADAGGIMTIEENELKKSAVRKSNQNKLFVRVAKNLNKKLVPDRYDIKDTVLESVFEELQAVLVKEAKLKSELPFVQQSGYNELLAAPLTKGDEIYGLLFLAKRKEFKQVELQLIKPIAIQGSILIKNNQLFEKMQRNVAELSTLQRISKIINSTLDLEQVLELTVDVIIGTMGVSACAVMLVDKKDQNLKLKASCGLPDKFKELVSNIDIKAQNNIFTEIVKSKEATIYNQIEPELKEKLGFRDMKSIISLPLKVREDVIGIVTAINTFMVNSFNDEDKRFLITLSNQVAIAIENARMYNQMEEMAIRDGLTQLYNHSYFQEALSDEIERAIRYEQQLSLLLLDIDNFKNFNDNYGHQLGDQALKKLANNLKSITRGIDIVARYGGEEFAIILPETGLAGAKKLGERINKSVREMVIQKEDAKLQITISVGAATHEEDLTQEELINRADRALYKAKEEGKDRTCVIE